MGDSSDNIPGVPGVGEKTAIKLLKQFGTMENIYENLDQVSGKKLKEKLTDNEEQAKMSKVLATIEKEAPVEVKPEELPYNHEITDEVVALFKELEFKSLLDRLGYESDISEAAKDIEIRLNM